MLYRNILLIAVMVLVTAVPASAQTVFVEAESFDTEELYDGQGAWVVDQQFMDQMGSPFLLAHGLGYPVNDATKEVTLPSTGVYRVWVRTRDWAATFDVPGSPGKFMLAVNGEPLKTVFGTEGKEWHWQDGGTINIPDRRVNLALRDLTGFDGRCDAIVFSKTHGFEPPNDPIALAEFRRISLGLPSEPQLADKYGLVVVGGGVAGTATAVSAARLGVHVALIQNRPVLGGNSSSEVRVTPGGGVNQEPYPALGNLVLEIVPSTSRGNAHPGGIFEDDKKLRVVEAEENIDLFLNMHAYKVEMDGARIKSVYAKHIRDGYEMRFDASLFADCTGDGTIGYLAGADFRMGREGRGETGESLAPDNPDKMTMGATVMWRARETPVPIDFPSCPWAIQFSEETCHRTMKAEWFWETGMNLDQIEDFERVRDHGLRAAYGNWDFLKNKSEVSPAYAKYSLEWVAFIAGKRESRRLLGDVILQEQDVLERKSFPDAAVTCTWSIDLHYPKPENTKHFPGEEFLSIAKHKRFKPGYPIPYRCFYSRNIDNLFMAGRNISVTHVALGTVRVMRTTGMMGEVVGMAAALCTQHKTNPRGVYEDNLDELIALMRKGVGVPPPPPPEHRPPDWLNRAGKNLARDAEITVYGNYDLNKYPISNINDGLYDFKDNSLRWVSDRKENTRVELAWPGPQTFNALRIVTGQSGGGTPRTPITDFYFEYRDGTVWKTIADTKTNGNVLCDWSTTVNAVTTDQLRLVVTAAPGDLTRIWELEVYNMP